jgi:MscS family membrane protein
LLAAAALAHAAPAEKPHDPLRPADTSSPRATLNSFIESCNEVYEMLRVARDSNRRDPKYMPAINRVLDCLDLSEIAEYAREDAGGDAIVFLKEVIDRIDIPPEEEVPDAEAIAEEGGDGEFYSWRIPNTRITIARVEEGPRRGEYLFTPETLERAEEFYEQVKHLPYRTEGPAVSKGLLDWYFSEPGNPTVAALVHRLPDWCGKRVYGLAVWQWIGLVLAILIGMLVMFAAYYLGRYRSEDMQEWGVSRYCVTLLFPVVAMLVPLGLKYFVYEDLTIRGRPLHAIMFSANLVFLAAVLVVIVGVGSRVAEIIISSPRIHPRGLDAQLIRIVCKLLSLVAVIIVFLEGGKYLGVPLTTLLASAGVGGLAVALAAQDTLKCLFGSMMILLDKPYRAGDRVIVGDYDGVVEEIGLRSTKLRLLTGHMASIPNEEMARNRIENVGRRPHIRRVANLHIPLDTPRVKLEKAIELIRAALDDHDGMPPDFPPRVFFNEFNPDSFNIRIIYWFHPPNYWDFLAFSEKLNLAVCRAFDDQGIQFSLPTRVTYTTTESKSGPVKVKLVAEKD